MCRSSYSPCHQLLILKDIFHMASSDSPALPKNCSFLRALPVCGRQALLLSVPQLMPQLWTLCPCFLTRGYLTGAVSLQISKEESHVLQRATGHYVRSSLTNKNKSSMQLGDTTLYYTHSQYHTAKQGHMMLAGSPTPGEEKTSRDTRAESHQGVSYSKETE